MQVDIALTLKYAIFLKESLRNTEKVYSELELPSAIQVSELIRSC